MSYHHLLEEQLRLYFPGMVPEGCQALLDQVSRTYANYERDRELTEKAFSINEREYLDVVSHLNVQNSSRKASIQKLKMVIMSLDPQARFATEEGDDELVQVVDYLEQQLKKAKQMERELIEARNEALHAMRAKADFLSVMSHEIRTPLNAITGIVHLMMQEEFPASQTEHLNTLNIAAENLLNLINDILDFSKIEEGKIVFSEKNMDLRQAVYNIKLANRIRAEERGNRIVIQIDPQLPHWLRGDEIRLGQILNNLVSNAVKFTTNGLIGISVQLVTMDDTEAELLISVSDTGIGIAPDKQQLIFDRFTQANSDITREYGGSGLGLAIIRRLLQLMGSDILLESQPGKGSKFSFPLRLKRARDTENEIRTVPLNADTLKGIRVLLVEDVAFNVLVAEKMLSNWNVLVDVADNGLKAVSMARENKYDLVLMDLQMPVLDGYSATRHIREFDKQIPIIALTASASPDIQHKVREYGMCDYVSKPFKPSDLFDTIYRNSLHRGQIS